MKVLQMELSLSYLTVPSQSYVTCLRVTQGLQMSWTKEKEHRAHCDTA